MAIQKDVIINRKEYERIKRMDHNQMNKYLIEMYKNGFEEGVTSVPGVDLYGIEKILIEIKGLGAKRVADIIAVLEKEMK